MGMLVSGFSGIEDGCCDLPTEELSKGSTKLDLQDSQVSVKNRDPPKSVKTSSLGGPKDIKPFDQNTQESSP